MSALVLVSGSDRKASPEYREQGARVLCVTRTPTSIASPPSCPEFGAFEPSGWVTLTHSPICSISVRDLGSGLDPASARYRWSSSGPEHLSQQRWLSVTASGGYGSTELQTVAVTIPFTQDSSSRNVVQFAITNTAGCGVTSAVHIVQIDTMPPGPWQGFGRAPDLDEDVAAGQLVTYTIVVSDATSGLDCGTASFRHWTEEGWSDWGPAVCAETIGITMSQILLAPNIPYLYHSPSLVCDNENKVEFHIADVAGHSSSALRQEESCSYAYLPAIVRCYPPDCCDAPLNGDFALCERGIPTHWNRDIFAPLSGDPDLVIECWNGKVRMGTGWNDGAIRVRLPGYKQCAFARLYQDFYLPYDCFDKLWLQFTYRLFSYDYERSRGDDFLVYIDDLDDGIRYDIYSDRSHQSRDDSLDGRRYDSGPITRIELLPSSLGGGMVRLWFEVRHCEKWQYTLAWYPTWIYLDNVITGSSFSSGFYLPIALRASGE
jgi:hypothetical protein